MKVHLRQRQHSKTGSISLYLEIYKGTTVSPEGKVKPVRDYEYLNLYLVDKPRNPLDRQQNKTNIELANNIRAKRELEIQNGQYGFSTKFKDKTNFIEYFKQITEKHFQTRGTYDHWDSVLKQVIKFAGTEVTFKDVDRDFCERFKDHLIEVKVKGGKNLSTNSIASYYVKFKACLNKAVDEDIILKNPAKNIETPKKIESNREFLTFDELKALTKAECKNEDLKKAFIFSCLTGLRWSDIEKLKWSEVHLSTSKDKNSIEKEEWKIVFHQQKTKGLQQQNISAQAREFLGERGEPGDRVFKRLSYSSYMNVVLLQWMLKAGITKQITFHSARHTNAILLLENGVDIYTISKLLGHTKVTTTQIYAKIFDEKKKEAVNKIPDLSL